MDLVPPIIVYEEEHQWCCLLIGAKMAAKRMSYRNVCEGEFG
jgi:hypothetical protein